MSPVVPDRHSRRVALLLLAGGLAGMSGQATLPAQSAGGMLNALALAAFILSTASAVVRGKRRPAPPG